MSNENIIKSLNQSTIFPGQVLNMNHIGKSERIELPKGRYKLECWGAQGGSRQNSGGHGGYAKGILELTERTILYICVGGGGQFTTAVNNVYSGGFNGGGYRYGFHGGGGATDIRIGQDSLYARVIVAGGGGSDGASNKGGGAGGGATGQNATDGYGSYGYGGTQTGHTTPVDMPSSQYTEFQNTLYKHPGGFGFGGFGCYQNSGYGGAGGGGWYGGCGNSPDSSGDDDKGGGGGSGYVYTSESAKNYPSGCLLNPSYYLTDTQLIAGNQSLPSPDGGNITGKQGNGLCRITVLECYNPFICKINNQIQPIQSIYFKKDNKIYSALNNQNKAIQNFEYTGNVQTRILQPGRYKLECWGAQGGSYNEYLGGAGGYSHGILNITQTTQLYIYVGEQPIYDVNSSDDIQSGGFNGGGTGAQFSYSGTTTYACSGGGATDIRIGQDSLYARVIVAGGGGGSASVNALTTKYGGGLASGCTNTTYVALQSKGGNGGSFGQGGNAGTSYGYRYGSGGGGGGWYGGGAYPSQSDSDTSVRNYNGGGSGYVYTSSAAKDYPSGCVLNSSYYLTNAEIIAGNQSFPSPTGGTETGHTGNGFCRITQLDYVRTGIYIKQNNQWKYIQ